MNLLTPKANRKDEFLIGGSIVAALAIVLFAPLPAFFRFVLVFPFLALEFIGLVFEPFRRHTEKLARQLYPFYVLFEIVHYCGPRHNTILTCTDCPAGCYPNRDALTFALREMLDHYNAAWRDLETHRPRTHGTTATKARGARAAVHAFRGLPP